MTALVDPCAWRVYLTIAAVKAGRIVLPRSYTIAYRTEITRRARARRRDHADRVCEECGERFTPARSDSLYHSAACRQRAYRRRKAKTA